MKKVESEALGVRLQIVAKSAKRSEIRGQRSAIARQEVRLFSRAFAHLSYCAHQGEAGSAPPHSPILRQKIRDFTGRTRRGGKVR